MQKNDRERLIKHTFFRGTKKRTNKQGTLGTSDAEEWNKGFCCLNGKMRNGASHYTPYRVASLSWIAGGKVETWAAHPASSCCLNPCSRVWNMLFNSGEGAFHRIIELQNQRRLLAIPAGFVCTSVHKPLNALSFSSLSLISYNA